VDSIGITRPCVKHNMLVKDVRDLATTIKKAFYIATTGRPGPVVVDIPKDVTAHRAEYHYPKKVSMRSYNPVVKGHAGQIKRAVELMLSAKRPMIYTGGGVILDDASKPLIELTRLLGFPITNTLMGLGAYPATDRQFVGMLGMHGTYEANLAMHNCDVLIAIGQENAFPWIEKETGIRFTSWGTPIINDDETFQSTNKKVFFGGDAAFGPANIITAVAHGHKAAVSIDLYCNGQDLEDRPPPNVTLISQKMGIHEWSYDSIPVDDKRVAVPLVALEKALGDRDLEVELGFDPATAFVQAERCLNCDAQTVFTAPSCIECDACADICPTSCINFVENAPEEELRPRLMVPADNPDQDLFVSDTLATGKVLVKDEDVCLHCGLCAERCPTAAWDMQLFTYNTAKAAPNLLEL